MGYREDKTKIFELFKVLEENSLIQESVVNMNQIIISIALGLSILALVTTFILS